MRRARVAAVIVGICTALTITSCASITVNSLPQPGGSGRGGYPIVIEFENILNLPERAKVVQGGTTIGTVTSVGLKGDHVDVTAQIDPTVVVPSNTRATLQQSTVLGDIYLALERPPASEGPAPGLVPGGRVPLDHTTSPPQLEDTIANLANFVGSGSIQRMQNSIIGVNRVTPADRQQLRQLVSRVAVDLSDLSNNMDTVDLWLQGVSGTGQVMHDHLPIYNYWFTPAGMLGFDRATQVAGYIGTVLPSIGSIYSGGYWLVPMLNSLADAVGAVQHTKWGVEDEAEGWRRLFTKYFLPADKNPAINITSIKGPDGAEMINNVQDVLRILGAMP
jgi:virulence factor Mce-like protein